MNRYEEIKKLLNSSRKIITENNKNENKQILEKYYIKSLNELEDSDDEFVPILDKETRKSEKSKTYRISGGLVTIYSIDKRNIELTTEDKKAFQESMDEFVNEVTDLVDFNKMNIYKDNVEWSGKITEYDVDFFINIGESNGVYVKSDMLKLDDDFLKLVGKLRQYFEKFKARWSKIIAIRKKTPKS